MSDLEIYLREKRIDGGRFRATRPDEYARWESEWAVLGKAAFDQRKKFLLNPLRLEFPLGAAESLKKAE